TCHHGTETRRRPGGGCQWPLRLYREAGWRCRASARCVWNRPGLVAAPDAQPGATKLLPGTGGGGTAIRLWQLRSLLWPAVQAAGVGVVGLYRAVFGDGGAGADQLRPRLPAAPAQQPD